MPTTGHSPSPATASPSFARTRASLEPEDPYDRALCRIKGEGRRRIVAGLFALNVPLSRIPAVLLRENLTVAEHGILWRKNSWPLAGEALPDLLPGEVEEARLLWLLPKDTRVISLRARPDGPVAAWRAVDDEGGTYRLPGAFTPWPVSDAEVAFLFDRLQSESFRYPIGGLAACWEVGRGHGLDRARVRDCILVRSVTRGLPLRETVDELFRIYWEEFDESSEAGKDNEAEEVPQ